MRWTLDVAVCDLALGRVFRHPGVEMGTGVLLRQPDRMLGSNHPIHRVVKGLCVTRDLGKNKLVTREMSLNVAVIRELVPSVTRNLLTSRTVISESCINVRENRESNSGSDIN